MNDDRGFVLPAILMLLALASLLSLQTILSARMLTKLTSAELAALSAGNQLRIGWLATADAVNFGDTGVAGICTNGLCGQNSGVSARYMTVNQSWSLGRDLGTDPDVRGLAEYLGEKSGARWWWITSVRRSETRTDRTVGWMRIDASGGRQYYGRRYED